MRPDTTSLQGGFQGKIASNSKQDSSFGDRFSEYDDLIEEHEAVQPPIWEWFVPPIKMVIWGMASCCFTHMIDHYSLYSAYSC